MMGESTIAVVGLKRYGKSSHVVRMTSSSDRIIFYDSLNDDYSQGVVCRSWDVFRELWLSSYRGLFRLTFKPDDPILYFEQFCTMAYECGDCTVVIDEVQLFNHGSYCPPAFVKLITAGGHPKVDLIGVTQAPKKLGELLRSQASEWHIFAIREDFHIKYVTERCPGVGADLIKTLPKYEYIHFVDGAEHYWRCKDDLVTGHVWEEVVPYEGPTVAARSESNLGADADAGREVERESEDGPETVPVS
jgi:hypothetical protein